MAKATATMRLALHYQPQYAQYFAENAALFNRVVAFYFDVIQAHEGILELSNKEALTALERLTHATQVNPTPIMELSEVAPDIPAMFRRAAINAAVGSARSFFSSLSRWRTCKERYEARQTRRRKKKKPFTERPPVPPRAFNKSAPFYAGLWKDRCDQSIVLKVWTGSCCFVEETSFPKKSSSRQLHTVRETLLPVTSVILLLVKKVYHGNALS